MKHLQFVKLATLVACVLIMTGCKDDFLAQEPQTQLSTEQVFADLDNVQPYLNGVYNAWREQHINRKGFYLMLGTDETQQGEYQVQTDAVQAAFDKFNGFYSSENASIAELWNRHWPVVIHASEAIYYLEKMTPASPEDSTRISSYLGQAYFYRGVMLFHLAQYWGSVPIPTVDNGVVNISPLTPMADVYKKAEADLTFALGHLSDTKSSDGRIPTIWVVHATLGRMYMSAWPESGMRDWAKAKEHLQKVVDSKKFSLMPSFAALWSAVDNCEQEAIYTFYFNNVWPDTNELQWYTGSRACSSDPNCYFGGYDLLIPTTYAQATVAQGGVWEEGDLRKNESIRYDFTYKGKKPAAVSGFGEDQLLPHIKKYEDIRIDGLKSFYESGKNVYYIRYADVLLLLAECENELGNGGQAVDLVNQVRQRAFGNSEHNWSAMSQEDFRKNLLDERIRELLCEGWRRMDLQRQGQFVTLVKARNRWAKEIGSLNDSHLLYPIPMTEIKTNPNLSMDIAR